MWLAAALAIACGALNAATAQTPPAALSTVVDRDLGPSTPQVGLWAGAVGYGSAIAPLDDEVIVGFGDLGSFPGAVEIWKRHPTGGWQRTQSPIPDGWPLPSFPWDPSPLGYGAAVAADDRWMFVGAPTLSRVFVFRRHDDGAWLPAGSLAPDPASASVASQRFGAALAFDGSTLVVGAPKRAISSRGPTLGGADRFIVQRDRISGPTPIDVPPSPGLAGEFGTAVAVDGGRIALAAPHASVSGAIDAGRVALFAVGAEGSHALVGLLHSPTPIAGGGFGTDIELSASRLAIAAPGESSGSIIGAGVVRIYDWDTLDAPPLASEPLLLFAGTKQNEKLGRVALRHDLVAIGSPNAGPGPFPTGSARLFRIELHNGALQATLVDQNPMEAEEPGTGAWNIGSEVSIGPTHWVYRRTTAFVSILNSVLRLRPLDGAHQDCDGDGVPDALAIGSGAIADCDENLVPDACELAKGDCDGNGILDGCEAAPIDVFSLDVTPGSVLISLITTTPFEALFLCRLTVPAGTDGIIRGVRSVWVGEESAPAAVAIYADPNQDGIPDDAALLRFDWIVPSRAIGRESVRYGPAEDWGVEVGAPGTSFFVGLLIAKPSPSKPSLYLRPYAAPAQQPAVTWIAAAPLGTIDLQAPATTPGFAPMNVAGWTNIICGAIFRSPLDLDGDGDLDACVIPGDLDGSGFVDAADLSILLGSWGTCSTCAACPADLDGDCAVGPRDLAMLLGQWNATR